MKRTDLKSAGTVTPDFFSVDVLAARRFYLDLSPPRQRRLTVMCGGVETCSPNYTIQRETFPFYSIEYVTRGSGQLQLHHHAHELRAGLVFSYGPGVPHQITGNPDDALVKYFVDFAGRGALDFLRAGQLPPGQVARVFPPDTLAALFEELIHSGQRGGRAGADLCVRLLECLGLKVAAARAPLTRAETVAFTTYQECRRHIEQHFRRLRTLDEIAAECHVNNAYLCRLFRRYHHQSPYQFLLRLKMNFAASRLRMPDVMIKQVAEETGFQDPFHFSRVFRNTLGLSPNNFRSFR